MVHDAICKTSYNMEYAFGIIQQASSFKRVTEIPHWLVSNLQIHTLTLGLSYHAAIVYISLSYSVLKSKTTGGVKPMYVAIPTNTCDLSKKQKKRNNILLCRPQICTQYLSTLSIYLTEYHKYLKAHGRALSPK